MAWTAGTNHEAMTPGAKVEYGEAEMGTNTVEVSTKLTKIFAAIAMYRDVTGVDTRLYCDLAITEGKVTFADGAAADKTFNYMLIGH